MITPELVEMPARAAEAPLGTSANGGARTERASTAKRVAHERALAAPRDQLRARPPQRLLPGDGRGYVLRRLLALADVAALTVAWAVAAGVASVGNGQPVLEEQAWLVAAALPLWLLIASVMGLYHLSDQRLGHSVVDEVAPMVLGLTLWIWVLSMASETAVSGSVEPLPDTVWWIAALVAVPTARALTRSMVRRRSWYQQQIAIVGTAKDVARVTRRLERHPELGIDVARVFEVEPGGHGGPQPNGNGGQLGFTGMEREPEPYLLPPELVAAASRAQIDRVIVASSPGDLDKRSELIRAVSDLKVHVDLISADSDAIPTRGSLHYIEGLPVLTISAMRRARSSTVLKRSFDVTVAALGLLLLSPLLAICALRIRLGSPGPIIFRQERVGLGGRRFQMLKLRTMVADAESQKPMLLQLNSHHVTETPGMFKLVRDPRRTDFGATLRRWSLDELPQLYNVLRGDMSLVGPRPLIPAEAELVRDHYEARMKARPGITGPWQTLGRSDIGFEDMVKLDYTYVTNWTFSEDLKLLANTVGAVLRGQGAY